MVIASPPAIRRTARLSLHHFEEPQKVRMEMLRVLKPGGTLAVADVVCAEDGERAALQNAIETSSTNGCLPASLSRPCFKAVVAPASSEPPCSAKPSVATV